MRQTWRLPLFNKLADLDDKRSLRPEDVENLHRVGAKGGLRQTWRLPLFNKLADLDDKRSLRPEGVETYVKWEKRAVSAEYAVYYSTLSWRTHIPLLTRISPGTSLRFSTIRTMGSIALNGRSVK